MVFQPTTSGKAPANGLELYYETFGNAENPAVLLTMGLDAQCIMYGQDFIMPLVEAGFWVIRYDNRDIGGSTWLNDTWRRNNPYTLHDMAKDAVGLLDFLNIEKAHLIGVSMGGMISQQLTLTYPARVMSLTSIMSSGFSLNPSAVRSNKNKILLRLLPFLLKRIYVKNKLTNHEVSVENYVKTYRRLAGTRFPFNESHFRAVFTEGIEKRKGQNPRARYQQYCAIAASGSRLKELPQIKIPTLIIHGTADPLVPAIHAQIYAPLIPNAKMRWIEGMGHEMPKAALPEILPEIIALLQQ